MKTWVLRVASRADLVRVPELLHGQATRPLMVKWGALFVAQAKKAWREQRLGPVVWKERYPTQKEPFINIWPVVFQANQGRTPTTIDFQRRPALRDRFGVTIAEGVAVQVVENDSVTVGHKEPWAGTYQYGLIDRMTITNRARTTLSEWIFGKWGSKGKHSKNAPRSDRMKYAKKLAFIFWRDEMVGKPHARPFLGLTDEIVDDMAETLARHVGAKPR